MANRLTSARRRQREELGDTDSSEEVTAVQQAILGDPAINSISTNSSRPPSRSKSRIGFKALGNMFAGSEKQQEQQSGSGLGLKVYYILLDAFCSITNYKYHLNMIGIIITTTDRLISAFYWQRKSRTKSAT